MTTKKADLLRPRATSQHSAAYDLPEVAESMTQTKFRRYDIPWHDARSVHPYYKKSPLPSDTHCVRKLWKVHIEAAISQANQYSDTHEYLDLTRYVPRTYSTCVVRVASCVISCSLGRVREIAD
ncbi:hypothetical protein PILCRDRAFT_667215 [Piloderma croceum F 1598]|uniref:Uncharacterized protein n=1 Tax=Piloderma croceum (strain F 1598) TaxID=765440 RepID=A0A0C3F740_PILCF|nr:hypothetical protein PILCRDRAFT_667215 [Piloderma croceum F 1598]